MSDDFNDSSRSNSTGAVQYTTSRNTTVTESAFNASWGFSSSSFLTTSLESEQDSSETDNNDDGDNKFIAELTRQMADYMLQEDEDDNNTPPECFVSKKSISQLKNRYHDRHRVGENSNRGRRGRMTQKSGSGMRAIFLSGSGLENGYNGTGVFLPPSATDQRRKKPGYSIAIVPTRVLHALEQHFNAIYSISPLNSLLHIQTTHQGQRSDTHQKLQMQLTSAEHIRRKLPDEWTY